MINKINFGFSHIFEQTPYKKQSIMRNNKTHTDTHHPGDKPKCYTVLGI